MSRLWPWFGPLKAVHFWQPILDPAQKWWRDAHILAHILGGVVWVLLLRGVVYRPPIFGGQLDFTAHAWLRLLGAAIIQLGWERVQVENWRPDRVGLLANSGYPWLSGI